MESNVVIETMPPAEELRMKGINIYMSGPGCGIIFQSPDGRTYKMLSIDNSGNPVWATVPSP
ncbi:MAG: hypothetical protein A3H28_12940 [Acidobacteria bacterium RIFCSPLOWO2_02_FULL_61_28]|nr:MAG: hypothetical protein A3H28_12940 [Acidobacteria bacterium RIFCSPLOWO2_02_FULL_61_28]